MATADQAIDFVFFDIGGTLGDRAADTGEFTPFPSTTPVLEKLKNVVGARIGVITNLGPDLTTDQGRELLQNAGLSQFLDPRGFVSDHEASAAKPDPNIYQFAAQQVGVPVERCLYVGENLVEVIGAMKAGMKALLKPCPPGRDVP
jgi:FMN phosphatase YigB (HAD superfamily)